MVDAFSNNNNDITYTSSPGFCCPNNEIVIYQGCTFFDAFTDTGATVLNIGLYQSAIITVTSTEDSTGNTTLKVTSAYATVPDTIVPKGGTASVYVPKASVGTIDANGFTGQVCVIIYNRVPR